MRQIIICVILIAYQCSIYGQPEIHNTQRILFEEKDIITYTYRPIDKKGFEIPFSLKKIAAEPDKTLMMNNNNEGWPGKHIYSTGSDSIVLESDKEQFFFFKITNGRDTINIYANFVNGFPNYSEAYRRTHWEDL